MSRPAPDPELIAACRAIMRTHAKSFSRAARLLPGRYRDQVAVLYAFCRLADDAVDLAPDAATARAEADRFIAELDQPASARPVIRAFDAWSTEHPLARSAARELCAGIASDAGPVRVADEDELVRYCYRVAGTVGLLMCAALDVPDPAAHPFAIDLGIAMQLTNIARDVAEDAQRDRVYLPRSALARHGTSPEALVARAHGGPESAAPAVAVAPVVLELLALADRYYHSAELGMRYLPWQVRPAILVAARLYRGIGEVLRQRGGNPWLGRAYVDRSDAARHAASALAALARARRGPHEPDLHHPIRDLPGANASML